MIIEMIPSKRPLSHNEIAGKFRKPTWSQKPEPYLLKKKKKRNQREPLHKNSLSDTNESHCNSTMFYVYVCLQHIQEPARPEVLQGPDEVCHSCHLWWDTGWFCPIVESRGSTLTMKRRSCSLTKMISLKQQSKIKPVQTMTAIVMSGWEVFAEEESSTKHEHHRQ